MSYVMKFIILVLPITLIGCFHDVKGKDPDVGTYGHKIFAYPRENDGPGTVYSTMDDGQKSVIDIVKETPSEYLAKIPSLKYEAKTSIDANLLISAIKGTPVNLIAGGKGSKSISAEIELDDVVTQQLTRAQLARAMPDICNELNKNKFFDNGRVFVIQSVVAAKKITYKFSNESGGQTGISAQLGELGKANVNYQGYKKESQEIISASFERPMNILYQDIKLDCKGEKGLLAYTAKIDSSSQESDKNLQASQFTPIEGQQYLPHDGALTISIFKEGVPIRIHNYSTYWQAPVDANGVTVLKIPVQANLENEEMAINFDIGTGRWLANAQGELVAPGYELLVNGFKIPNTLAKKDNSNNANFYLPLARIR